jgi:hypothetical protein
MLRGGSRLWNERHEKTLWYDNYILRAGMRGETWFLLSAASAPEIKTGHQANLQGRPRADSSACYAPSHY